MSTRLESSAKRLRSGGGGSDGCGNGDCGSDGGGNDGGGSDGGGSDDVGSGDGGFCVDDEVSTIGDDEDISFTASDDADASNSWRLLVLSNIRWKNKILILN